MHAWQQDHLTIADYERLSPLEKLETRILLMAVTGLTRIELITQSDYQINLAQHLALQTLIQRRLDGEPIAYLTGEREFFGLPFFTSPAVLIPRADTELLVELALSHAPENSALLDMGTGSGAIAVAIAHTRSDLFVTALDISPDALAIAQKNVMRHLAPSRVRVVHSDWYADVEGQVFHTIVSNPPYIVKDDPHLSQGDLRFEPINALTDHGDGLSAYRTIIAGAPEHLASDGWLLMEHGYHQADEVRQLLLVRGFVQVQSWRDLAGIERVSGGQFISN
ncbi:peptide chain release factor N(5)-glutamine methyltransferase [Undibacterium sp. RuRC25W]|uniref:peptide chain release factor N(5)-glutamine methyltransferase n=1 Tax=Undibacterium sp. RuRC25W TaxID=3413047 RepID=UPI003BF1367F